MSTRKRKQDDEELVALPSDESEEEEEYVYHPHLETTPYPPQSFNWLQYSFCDHWRASFGCITVDRALSCALGRKLSLAYVIYSYSNYLLIAVLRYRYEDSEDELPAGASDDDDDDSEEEEEDPEEEDGDVEGMRDLCLTQYSSTYQHRSIFVVGLRLTEDRSTTSKEEAQNCPSTRRTS
jgi:hypothetical protein